MDSLLALMLGVGLAAACGFRVFVPFFVVSLAASSGALTLADSFAWLGTPGARLVLGTASVLEVLAYYVPWIDNLLDAVATPAAVVAGTVLSAAVFTEMSPLLSWTLAIVAGGGAAGIVQVGTTALRATSTVTTAGFGNSVVSTGELVGAAGLSLLSIVLPLAGLLLAGALVLFVVRLRARTVERRRAA